MSYRTALARGVVLGLPGRAGRAPVASTSYARPDRPRRFTSRGRSCLACKGLPGQPCRRRRRVRRPKAAAIQISRQALPDLVRTASASTLSSPMDPYTDAKIKWTSSGNIAGPIARRHFPRSSAITRCGGPGTPTTLPAPSRL